MKYLIFLILLLVPCHQSMAESTYESRNGSNLVKVSIPNTTEIETIELLAYQTATIKVYLSSLGDMVDKFMVSLLNVDTGKVVASQLSDLDGIVFFRKIEPGDYFVYVNKRVKDDGEFSNVAVADVILSK